MKFYANLNNFVFPKDASLFYAFAHKYRESHDMDIDGWKLYDPMEEYKRQGINLEENTDMKLRLSYLNKNYALCSTYPEFIIIPSSIGDEELKEASNFRTKNRFPVLSYLYTKNHANYKTYAAIWRSSQTKSGITQNRSSADEKLLKSICDLSEKLVIYDARPYINALANRVYTNI